ncbi:MAG: Homoserine kinase [Nitrosomonadaceae bacterium]|nr:Homoserine kinase [Nitrosomonadaceae bacterium]
MKAIAKVLSESYKLDVIRIDPVREGLAFVESPSGRLVARIYSGRRAYDRASFVVALLKGIQAQGVPVEEIVSDKSGNGFTALDSAAVLVVFRWSEGTPFKLTTLQDYHAWGAYMGRLHLATGRVQSICQYNTPLTSMDPASLFAEAQRLSRLSPECEQVLLSLETRIVQGARSAFLQSRTQPVHGDLWPGNLLQCDGGLIAIDFSESGLGPIALDVATAYRWIPWEQGNQASSNWAAWFDGYNEEYGDVQVEVEHVMTLAALQRLRFMIEEVNNCLNGLDTPGVDPTEYVTDHVTNIRRFLF